MTPSTPRGLHLLKLALYVLAGLIFVLGMILGISLLTSANVIVANFLLPFQLMGAGQIANSFSSLLSGIFINLGVIAIVLTLVLSALLYAVGRLLGHLAELETRLARLEAA